MQSSLKSSQSACQYIDFAIHFDSVVDRLFYGSHLAESLKALSSKMVTDTSRLENNRGLKVPTIGFFGPKNAGKSTLLRALLSKRATIEYLRTGFGEDGRTEQLLWLGPTPPEGMDETMESFCHIDATIDTLLQRPAALVDIPGFSDPETVNAAEYALTSCQLKVLVIDAADVEREDAVNYGGGFDGAYILPVINRVPGDPALSDFTELTRSLEASVKKWAPRAKCFDAILIPHLRHEDVTWDEERRAQRMKEGVELALGQLQDLPGQLSAQSDIHFRLFRDAVKRKLPDFAGTVETVSADLDLAIGKVSGIAREMLGDEQAANTAVRLGIRSHVVDQTAAIYFPYRSVLRLLTLTSGAWDSAAMGLSGSIPSFALAAMQSFQNIRHQEKRSRRIENGLQQRLQREAIVKAAPVIETLCRELDLLGARLGFANARPHPMPAIEVVGIPELQEESRRRFSAVIRQYSPSKTAVTLSSVVGSVVFLAIMGPPLIDIYSDYGRVAVEVFQLNSASPADFPVIRPGIMFTSLTLALLPVFLIAGVMLATATSMKRVERAVAQLSRAHRELIEDALNSGTLSIRTEDPKIEAAQWLGRFLRDQKLS